MLKDITRIFAFFRKEMVDILRQPRILISVILGPFLILFLFGIGYRNQARSVRTLFVVPQGSNMAPIIQQYATSLGPALDFAGTTSDLQSAQNQLANGDVDLVVQVPQSVDTLIKNNQQAVFTLYHNEIDPQQASYIDYLGQNYISEVNRRVVSQFAAQAQTQTTQLTPELDAAQHNAHDMRLALQAGNSATAREKQTELRSNLSAVANNLETRLLLEGILHQEMGQSGSQDQNLTQAISDLKAIQNGNSDPSGIPVTGGSSNPDQIQQLQRSEDKIAQVETQLKQFQSISPDLLVSPFASQTKSIAPLSGISPAVFFTPAVIALLLQHMAVTFGALSIIRERRSGTMELFRVSPVSAAETLLGKYISYMTLGVLLAGVLTALMYFILKVPVLGSWENYALVVVLILFCSLGLGFVISLAAENESQAVQLAMISLLVSVFFSGMFLDLRYLVKPVQIISWLTPATYGTLLLQNVMLRGNGLMLLYVLGLFFIGLFLFLIALRSLRREMKLG